MAFSKATGGKGKKRGEGEKEQNALRSLPSFKHSSPPLIAGTGLQGKKKKKEGKVRD